MVLTVFNTLGRRKEEFVPLRNGEVNIYLCGPTVYDFIHIGNARAFIVADVVQRYLDYKGFKVKFVSNITDIDDKMIKRAEETGLSVQELGETYSDAYFEDAAKLNLKKPDVNPRATQHIPEIIEAINGLIDKGFAYQADGDVYFDVSKFATYGKLSGNKAEALLMGARIEVNQKKRNPADFALWKDHKEGEPRWHSPWGEGRPAWHIECSTMSRKYLGETFDIHMGGRDLIFPHHENEITQAEAAGGIPFAKYWLHNEWLTVDGSKMSKSRRNFLTVRDALEICKPQVLRFLLVSAHYRSPIDFNRDNLGVAETNLERLSNAIERLEGFVERRDRTAEDANLLSEVEQARIKFEEAMDDDFNTPLAISALFNIAKSVNSYAEKKTEIESSVKDEVLQTLRYLLGVLGITIEAPKLSVDRTNLVKSLLDLIVDLRQEFRKIKKWKISDEIRDRLENLGFVIEDTAEVTKWKIRKTI
jgi:cysteinyl-tRNA synthetase